MRQNFAHSGANWFPKFLKETSSLNIRTKQHVLCPQHKYSKFAVKYNQICKIKELMYVIGRKVSPLTGFGQ